MSNLTPAFVSALVDFVWQGTAVGVVAASALLAMRRSSPQARYSLCCAALIVMIGLPVVTTTRRYSPAAVPESTVPSIGQGAVAGSGDGMLASVEAGTQVTPVLTVIAPWILPVWSLGVLALSLRLLLGGLEVRTLRRSGQPADERVCALAAGLMHRMGVNRHVSLVTSPRAAGPSTIGWLRPVILLPPAAAMGLTVQQLEAVLAHELAHIRRYDYLVNILQMTVETLLFYHPAVWWVSHRMRVERERCCDDEAVRLCGDATAYARALVTMARQQVPLLAMGSSGCSLTDRVGRLLGIAESRPPVGAGLVTLAIALAFAAIAVSRVQGQSEPLRFEVASIRPADPAGPRGFSGLAFLPGGVVHATQVPILAIVATAYDLPWRQVEGPDDLMTERFAIDAKAPASALPPEGATFDQTLRAMAPVLQEMLKTLLAERFKLAGHTEKREVPLYALVVGSNGPKLKPAGRDCRPKTATDDPCGGQGGGPAGGLRLRGAEVAMLAEMLNSLLDRPVVDRTGIKGRYDIDLPSWNPGLPLRDQSADPDPEPQPDPGAPSISTVLQPLGLRLEPIRGPLDIYVVDHIERPAPN